MLAALQKRQIPSTANCTALAKLRLSTGAFAPYHAGMKRISAILTFVLMATPFALFAADESPSFVVSTATGEAFRGPLRELKADWSLRLGDHAVVGKDVVSIRRAQRQTASLSHGPTYHSRQRRSHPRRSAASGGRKTVLPASRSWRRKGGQRPSVRRLGPVVHDPGQYRTFRLAAPPVGHCDPHARSACCSATATRSTAYSTRWTRSASRWNWIANRSRSRSTRWRRSR